MAGNGIFWVNSCMHPALNLDSSCCLLTPWKSLFFFVFCIDFPFYLSFCNFFQKRLLKWMLTWKRLTDLFRNRWRKVCGWERWKGREMVGEGGRWYKLGNYKKRNSTCKSEITIIASHIWRPYNLLFSSLLIFFYFPWNQEPGQLNLSTGYVKVTITALNIEVRHSIWWKVKRK